jgi:carbonic anhydrase
MPKALFIVPSRVMNPVHFSALPALCLVFATLVAVPARGDEWKRIGGNRERTVEIDPTSVFDSDNHTKVAWGRVVLSGAEAAKSNFRTIKALNRYDCLNRSFITIKRVYLDADENVLMEEATPQRTPVVVMRNSADEQMWRAVCLPAPSSEATPIEPLPIVAGGKGSANRIVRVVAAADQAAKSSLAPERAAPTAPPPVAVAPPPAKDELQSPPPAAASGAVSPAPGPLSPPPAVLDPTAAAMPMPRIAPAQPLSPPPATRPSAASATPTTPATPTAPVPSRSASSPRPPERLGRAPTPVIIAARPPTAAAVRRAASGGETWRYAEAENWGKLRPEWRLCATGKRQSPIDLGTGGVIGVDLDPVEFDYRRASFRVTATNNMLRVKVGEGMGIKVRGRRYALEEFTLHHPGETRFDGMFADMEAHFAHRDRAGRRAFVAVLLELGDENPQLQTLLNNLPLERNGAHAPAALLDLGAFLPASPAHFLYMGSLSTPPCTEDVLWIVMKEPITLSPAQLDIFARLHPANARPPQPLNARTVLKSR